MIQRHFKFKKLTNTHSKRIVPSVWELPPYIIAEFGGNLATIMLEAAERYIYESCLNQGLKAFHQAAFSKLLSNPMPALSNTITEGNEDPKH